VVLRLSNVTKVYKMDEVNVQALRGIDLEVREGERVSIIGPSGSGKSTLLHILGLLDSPTSGTVELDGINTTAMTEAARAHFRGKKIGFVFQSFHLVASISARDNVELPMMFYQVPHEERHKIATETLEKLGLGDRLDHLPKQLSGGERQRVAIARALANSPSIILADEPTGNLDSKSGAEVIKIFDKLHDEGKTIIVVTHDPNIAKLSKRMVKIKDGEIEEDTTQ